MRGAVMLVAVAAVLGLAGAAQAGCWATAGISPLPTAVEAGGVWAVDVTVLQHGRTPMPDAKPEVVITNAKTGETQTIAALPTSAVGVYRADVTFPSAGSWDVAVNDGFPVAECATTHTFGAYAIGGGGAPATPAPEPAPAAVPAGPSADGSSVVWPVVGGVAGALALAALAAFVMRARKGRDREVGSVTPAGTPPPMPGARVPRPRRASPATPRRSAARRAGS